MLSALWDKGLRETSMCTLFSSKILILPSFVVWKTTFQSGVWSWTRVFKQKMSTIENMYKEFQSNAIHAMRGCKYGALYLLFR